MKRRTAGAVPFLDQEASRRVSGRVRELRTAAGLPQHALASVLGVSQPMVSNLELGRDCWRKAAAAKAAVFLGTTLEGLLEGPRGGMSPARAALVLPWPESRRAAAALRAARLASGKYLADVARELGCSRAKVHHMETGVTRMTMAEVQRLAAAVGVNAAGLGLEEAAA